MAFSFEKTSSRLTKSEVATQQTQEQISRLLELVKFLFTEIDRLDTTLEKIIIAASVVVGTKLKLNCQSDALLALQVLTVLLICQLRRGQKKMRQLEESQITMDMLKELLEGQKKKRKHGGGAGDGFSRRRNRLTYALKFLL